MSISQQPQIQPLDLYTLDGTRDSYEVRELTGIEFARFLRDIATDFGSQSPLNAQEADLTAV